MTQKELDKIVEQHQHWLKEDCEGWENMKADLHDADLRGVDLSEADLSWADLSRADLRGAYLSWVNLRGAYLIGVNLRGAALIEANLYKADLSEANLRWADLYKADLHDADLSCADLRGTNLRYADLRGANLSEADLSLADLRGTVFSVADKFRLGEVLDEPLVGYKKTKEGVVITAGIPAGAIVFCINGRKCRTNKAKIVDMDGHEVLHSRYDNSFEYHLGEEIEIKDFDLMYNVECASGFHFFRTRKEAEEYL